MDNQSYCKNSDEQTKLKDSESPNELTEINNGIKVQNKGIFNKDIDKNNQHYCNDIDSKMEIDITGKKKDLSQKINRQNLISVNNNKKEKNGFLTKKTRRSKSYSIEIEKKNNNTIKKEEDKNNSNNKKRHTKDDCDNIIKKVKCYFLKSLVLSVNPIIKEYQSNKEKDYTLKKLSYKYSEQLNKQINLELLDKPIKDVLSLEINRKYKYISNKDYNKEIIQILLNDENDIIKEILNITFSDWLDHFRNKKAKLINGKEIIFKSEDIFQKLKKKYNEEYISKFKEKIFDYDNYFRRKRKKKI